MKLILLSALFAASIALATCENPDPTCVPAPLDAASCGSGASCTVDADCQRYPGTFCDAVGCRDEAGCLRGRCNLTRVQGAPCDRDGQCVSNHCDDGACVPEGADGGIKLP